MDILAAQILPQTPGAGTAALGLALPTTATGAPLAGTGAADAFTALLAGMMSPDAEMPADMAAEQPALPQTGGDTPRHPQAPRFLLNSGLVAAATQAAPAVLAPMGLRNDLAAGTALHLIEPATPAEGAEAGWLEMPLPAVDGDSAPADQASLDSAMVPTLPVDQPATPAPVAPVPTLPGWADLTIRPVPTPATPDQVRDAPVGPDAAPIRSAPASPAGDLDAPAPATTPAPAASPAPVPAGRTKAATPAASPAGTPAGQPAPAAAPVQADATAAGAAAQPDLARPATAKSTAQRSAPTDQPVAAGGQDMPAVTDTAAATVMPAPTTAEAAADMPGTARPDMAAAATMERTGRATAPVQPTEGGPAMAGAAKVGETPEQATGQPPSAQAEAAAEQRDWRARAQDARGGEQPERVAAAAAARPAPVMRTAEAPAQPAGGSVQALAAAAAAPAAQTGGEQTQTGSGGQENAPGESDLSLRPQAQADGARAADSDFAQLLAPTRPGRPAHAGPAPQQIAVHIQRAAAEGQDRLTLQLRPLDLGRIEVQLDFGKDGVLRAKVFADNAATLDMLQRDARGLERALSEAGLKTDSNGLSFSLRDQGGQAQRDQDEPRGRSTGVRIAGVADSDLPDAPPPTRILGPGRVDVRI